MCVKLFSETVLAVSGEMLHSLRLNACHDTSRDDYEESQALSTSSSTRDDAGNRTNSTWETPRVRWPINADYCMQLLDAEDYENANLFKRDPGPDSPLTQPRIVVLQSSSPLSSTGCLFLHQVQSGNGRRSVLSLPELSCDLFIGMGCGWRVPPREES